MNMGKASSFSSLALVRKTFVTEGEFINRGGFVSFSIDFRVFCSLKLTLSVAKTGRQTFYRRGKKYEQKKILFLFCISTPIRQTKIFLN